jgi:hypothetical protein
MFAIIRKVWNWFCSEKPVVKGIFIASGTAVTGVIAAVIFKPIMMFATILVAAKVVFDAIDQDIDVDQDYSVKPRLFRHSRFTPIDPS